MKFREEQVTCRKVQVHADGSDLERSMPYIYKYSEISLKKQVKNHPDAYKKPFGSLNNASRYPSKTLKTKI